MMEKDLLNKVILITGGTSGVGKQTILQALKRGAQVCYCWGHSEDKYLLLQKELAKWGDFSLGIKADVSREEDVENLFEEAIAAFGKIDCVISNAALSRDSLLVSLPMEKWEEIVSINLTGAFLVCREAVRNYLGNSRKGKIVISGSLAGTGTPSNACYSLSKGGLLGLMKFLAATYENEGITTNLVTFGLINTEMTRDYPEYAKQVLIQSSILRRYAEAEEAAKLLLYLASDAVQALNGQNIYATNGLTDFPLFHGAQKDNG